MKGWLWPLVSGRAWRQADVPFMERFACQAGRVAFWVCVVYAVLLTIAGEWYGVLLAPIGLFLWWLLVMTARVMQDFRT